MPTSTKSTCGRNSIRRCSRSRSRQFHPFAFGAEAGCGEGSKEKPKCYRTVAEQRIDSRDAVGLRVAHKNHQEVRLFFDKTSALPIKSEVKFVAKLIDDIQKEVLVEIFFSKYKEIAGVSHFTRVRIHFDDDDLEINLKEVDLREKLDAAVFEKP